MAKGITEQEAKLLLNNTLDIAHHVVSEVSRAFKEDWNKSPSTGVRAVLGYWMVTAVRHYVAYIVLCEERDLSIVADPHFRQILELQLQIRYFLAFYKSDWDVTAQRISAFGCIDYLEKLKSLKDHPDVISGYQEVEGYLSNYDPALLDQIQHDRAQRRFYWFGQSFSSIAAEVSKDGEDLKTLYHLQSADMHGSWGLTLGVANPEPGSLDFRGYPDLTTMYRWAAESLDLATQTNIHMWNEIAEAVGAPTLNVKPESGD